MDGTPHGEYEDNIDFRELFERIWQGKIWILGAGGVAGIVAVIIALNLPNIYTAQVVLSPVADTKQSSLSGLAGSLGGLASLAGVDINSSSGVNMAVLGMETLKSRVFLINFISRHEMLVPLLGAKGWDENTQNWIIDPDLYDAEADRWVREMDSNKSVKPTDLEAFKVFSEDISISQDKKTQILSLTVQSKSPLFAKIWAEKLVHDLNDYLREKDVEQARRSINYLRKQLEVTSLAQMQAILYQLIEEQTKTVMLASVRDGYAFRIIDPPVIPEEKSKPKRSMIVLFSVIASMAVAAFFMLVKGPSSKKE